MPRRCSGSDVFVSELLVCNQPFVSHASCLKLFLGTRHSSPLTLKRATGAAERPWHGYRVWGTFAKSPGVSGPLSHWSQLPCPHSALAKTGSYDHTELELTQNFSNYTVKVLNVLKKGAAKLKGKCQELDFVRERGPRMQTKLLCGSDC